MNSINIDNVWRNLRSTRKVFAYHFLQNLRKKNSFLYQKLRELDIKDNYVLFQDRFEKNFREDFSTTTLYTSSLSNSSNESDYKSDFDSSDNESDTSS